MNSAQSQTGKVAGSGRVIPAPKPETPKEQPK